MKKLILLAFITLSSLFSWAQEIPQVKESTGDEIHNFYRIDEIPKFTGEMAGWVEYLQKNLQYPTMARENNISGRVFVQFVVEKDGSLTDIKVLRGIGGGCDEEAIRMIKNSPKWKPGRLNGYPVRVSFLMPIIFRLADQQNQKL